MQSSPYKFYLYIRFLSLDLANNTNIFPIICRASETLDKGLPMPFCLCCLRGKSVKPSCGVVGGRGGKGTLSSTNAQVRRWVELKEKWMELKEKWVELKGRFGPTRRSSLQQSTPCWLSKHLYAKLVTFYSNDALQCE